MDYETRMFTHVNCWEYVNYSSPPPSQTPHEFDHKPNRCIGGRGGVLVLFLSLSKTMRSTIELYSRKLFFTSHLLIACFTLSNYSNERKNQRWVLCNTLYWYHQPQTPQLTRESRIPGLFFFSDRGGGLLGVLGSIYYKRNIINH